MKRIAGGNEVRYGLGDSTWTVRIRNRDGSAGIFCAGALVTNSHVVTAAQCVDHYKTKPYELVVRAGDWSKQTDAGEVVKVVKNIAIHPEYHGDGVPNNDVAVLELVTPVEWDKSSPTGYKYIRPVALPTSDMEWTHQKTLFTVSGWGSRTKDEYEDMVLTETLNLHQTWILFVGFQTCGSRYDNAVKRGMLCAGDNDRHNVCMGDVGAPLVTFESWFRTQKPTAVGFNVRNTTDITQTLTDTEGDERLTRSHPKIIYISEEDVKSKGGIPILAGVSSWVYLGQGCARAEFPGVYADMRTYREWILRQTGGEPIWIITP